MVRHAVRSDVTEEDWANHCKSARATFNNNKKSTLVFPKHSDNFFLHKYDEDVQLVHTEHD